MGCRQGRAAIRAPSLKTAKFCLQLTKVNIRKLVGIWTGHCRLNKHLHILGIVSDPTCRGCLEEDETAEHVLCYCPALSSIRDKVLGDPWPSMADLSGASPAVILELINAVGWLND